MVDIKKYWQQHGSWWWHSHYALDYALVVVVLVVGGIVQIAISPFDRTYHDSEVEYPLKDDIVPTWLLFLLCVALPLLAILVKQYLYPNLLDTHHFVLGFLWALSLDIFITNCLKIMCGRPRPDFDPETNDTTDARLSFPSGHSSASFATQVFISLYINGKLKIFVNHTGSMVLKAFLSFSPLLLAFFISASRTLDYHHNFSDIVAGALIGSGIAVFCYFLYFPSLFRANCDTPRIPHGAVSPYEDVKIIEEEV